jgi:tetraacyldisaccharide 4'-kinase
MLQQRHLDWLERTWLSKGWAAKALWPLSLIYAGLFRLKALAYQKGWRSTLVLPVPVVVVGNLVVGGAGKTPTLLALIDLLRDQGWSPGVISRGYGRSSYGVRLIHTHSLAQDSGDEPLLIHLRSKAPVAVGKDRIAAAQALLAAHPQIDILLSDDGLQHTRLGRDVQIIVFDERGVGNGWLLPAGPLRQRCDSPLARSLVVYNASQATVSWPGFLMHRRLTGLIPLSSWWQGRHEQRIDVRALSGQKVWAVAGVARPGRFFGMLKAAGLQVQPCALPDHYDFAALPWPIETPIVVVTEKDAVKLKPERSGTTQVWVACLTFEFPPPFVVALKALLPIQGPHPGDAPH